MSSKAEVMERAAAKGKAEGKTPVPVGGVLAGPKLETVLGEVTALRESLVDKLISLQDSQSFSGE